MKQTLLLSFSLVIFLTAFAQTNQWTWTSGDSVNYKTGIYGVKGAAATSNKPGARYAIVTWTDASGNLWLFGGAGFANSGLGYMNDLWKFTPSTNQWVWMSGDSIVYQLGIYGTKGIAAAANKPGARIYSTSWTDASGNLWLFGGDGYAASGYSRLNDLWKFNPSTGWWTWMGGDDVPAQPGIYGTKGTASPINKPGARSGALSWTDKSGDLWMFGGSGYTGYQNDLWRYSILTGLWTWMAGDNVPNRPGIYGSQGTPAPVNNPGSRTGSVSWTDPSGNLWLFGGTGLGSVDAVGGLLNDLWKYEPSSGQWTWVSGDNVHYQTSIYGTKGLASAASRPGARASAASFADSFGNLWLFGGYTYSGSNVDELNDLWVYKPSTGWWTWVNGDSIANQSGVYGTRNTAYPANKPGSRQAAGSWSEPSGKFWLFGGIGYVNNVYGFSNDLWQYSADPTPAIPYFTAMKVQETALLSWTSSLGQNTRSFVVERYNGTVTGYQSIGMVLALDIATSHYSFTDNTPLPGTNFYRIRLVDQSGRAAFSSTAQVDMNQYATQFSVHQNPVQNVLQLVMQLPAKQKIILQVRDMNGRVLIQQEQTGYPGRASISVPVDRLNKGTYLIQMRSESINITKTFIKQ